ncbi:MAG: hypothetical protein CVT96_03295 [Bacteroidetes bacterium HGW-Bacteroidetes-13]|nr:MAG: hypothetical protein CVT96_03295 [Bacteroidetes bacterium HGW-Bacteroidetes-13]
MTGGNLLQYHPWFIFLGNVVKNGCQLIFKDHLLPLIFYLAKANLPECSGGLPHCCSCHPAIADAIYELRLALANRSRFVIVLALAKLSML